jgi:hypothetical protein
MHTNDTVVVLSTIAVPLPAYTDGFFTTLGRTGFVDAADGLGMSMLAGDDLLASISYFFFVPLDRFQEPLERSRSGTKLDRHCLDVLAMNVGQLPAHIHPQQVSSFSTFETIGEQRKKQSELPAQGNNLL